MPSSFESESDRLKRAMDELVALNRIANAINSLMSVEDISRVIIDSCLGRIKASQGAIFLLDETEKQADKMVTFSRGFATEEERTAFHLNIGLTGWMIKNNDIFLCNDVTSDRFLGKLHLSRSGIHSLLSAPLLTHRGLIGLLVLFNKKKGGFAEDDRRFLGIVGTQVARVIENARLREKELRLIQLEEELRVAHRIQEGFLPKEDLNLKGCQVCGINLPAKDVGGDFYDYIKIDEDRHFFSIGDVSGKGVPAALLMSNIQAFFRSQVLKGTDVNLINLAEGLNNMICQYGQKGQPETLQFVTAIFGQYNCQTGLLRYINGGHPAPIIIRKNNFLFEPGLPDLIVGVVAQYQFTVREIPLQAGDTVFLYSDGVTEAFSPDGTMFGEEKLMEAIKSCNRDELPCLCRALLEKVSMHCQNLPRSDDITMLAMKILND
ncbi:putative Serine phosphatase [Candidatus Zixiibacteriota bacterium]|nr:putative Serine phosphatase [candidate division Zixibacteria bacterium]